MPAMYADIECTVLRLDTVGIFTNLATCSIGPFRFAMFEQQAMLQIMLVMLRLCFVHLCNSHVSILFSNFLLLLSHPQRYAGSLCALPQMDLHPRSAAEPEPPSLMSS
jgi:hypothetical protein